MSYPAATLTGAGMITTERIRQLGDIIKWKPVFEEAGLNASTMRSAVCNGRPLHPEEAEKIQAVLVRHGLLLTAVQRDLFSNVASATSQAQQ